MAEPFLLRETGRGTVGANFVVLGTLAAGVTTYIVSNDVLLPAFTDKEIYGMHHGNVSDLQQANRELESAQHILEKVGDKAGVAKTQETIGRNQTSIQAETAQYPEG